MSLDLHLAGAALLDVVEPQLDVMVVCHSSRVVELCVRPRFEPIVRHILVPTTLPRVFGGGARPRPSPVHVLAGFAPGRV